ncbi:MAG: hypothetical protein WCK74_05250 [Gemmatimonadaceae bacterium]
MRGTPSAEPLPVAGLPTHAQQWRFRWQYADRVFSAAGDGVVRSLPPDSARLDFFLADGSAGGVAWLLGDTLSAGDGALAPELLPSMPLLWAAVGRLVIPASPQQTVHRQGDTVFAEIPERQVAGTPGGARSVWRLTVVPDALLRLEELIDHRVVASVERGRASTGQWVVHYVATRARRRLRLDIQDTFSVERFDDAIWRRP